MGFSLLASPTLASSVIADLEGNSNASDNDRHPASADVSGAATSAREQSCVRIGFIYEGPDADQLFRRVAGGFATGGRCARLVIASSRRLIAMMRQGRIDMHLAAIRSNPLMDPEEVVRIEPAVVVTASMLLYRRAPSLVETVSTGFDLQDFQRNRMLAYVPEIVWQHRLSAGFAYTTKVADGMTALTLLKKGRVDGLLINKVRLDRMGQHVVQYGAHKVGDIEAYMYLSKARAELLPALQMIATEAFPDGPLQLGSAAAR